MTFKVLLLKEAFVKWIFDIDICPKDNSLRFKTSPKIQEAQNTIRATHHSKGSIQHLQNNNLSLSG